jgi:hypothetical protein
LCGLSADGPFVCGVKSMGRKRTRVTYVVRPELEFFYERIPGNPEERGRQCRSLLQFLIQGYKAGEYNIFAENEWKTVTEEEFHESCIEQLFFQWSSAVVDQRAELWAELKSLFDAGVIKKQAFVEYLVKRDGKSVEEAVTYIAATFGMDEKTQKTYLSDMKRRLAEKQRTVGWRAEKAWPK